MEFRRYLPHLGVAWKNYLVATHGPSARVVFLKDPSIEYLARFFDLFPNDKLILLIREGRDNVASSERAAFARRKTDSVVRRLKRGKKKHSLVEFVAQTRSWARPAGELDRHLESKSFRAHADRWPLVRFENLFLTPEIEVRRIFEFCEVPFTDTDVAVACDAPVIGSSFYGVDQTERSHKPGWRPTKKSKDFRFIGRW